jgi:ferric-dicitrate binding protein FerR (iron transport regulator)
MMIDRVLENELNRWISESDANKQEYLKILKLFDISDNLIDMNGLDPSADLLMVKKRFYSPVVSPGFFYYFSRIASILVIPLFVLSAWLLSLHFENESARMSAGKTCQYETALGIRSRITLSDGTRVWLNSGSKLEYPTKFEKGRREVILQGEAFFEVHSDRENPFYVDLVDYKVKATGTKFNLSNYLTDKESSAYLSQGELSIVKENGRREVTLGKLQEGEAALFDKSQRKHALIGKADGEKYLGWLKGRLIFRNDYMDQVADRLGRWFNAEIIIQDPELNDYFFTATFQNETLEQALDLLGRSSPINYRMVSGFQNEDASFSKRKVIIMKKESRKN